MFYQDSVSIETNKLWNFPILSLYNKQHVSEGCHSYDCNTNDGKTAHIGRLTWILTLLRRCSIVPASCL